MTTEHKIEPQRSYTVYDYGTGERENFEQTVKGPQLHTVIWDYLNWLRSQLKHGNLSDEADATLTRARQQLCELLSDEEVSHMF